MSDTERNICAILRGNILCGINRILGKCQYTNLIRVFKGAAISVNTTGRLILEKGVAIGERCQCIVYDKVVVKIGKMSKLNSYCIIVAHEKVAIGRNTIFEASVLINDHDHVYDQTTGVRRNIVKGDYSDGTKIIQKISTEAEGGANENICCDGCAYYNSGRKDFS